MNECKTSSEQSCYRNVLTAYNYLVREKNIKPESIVIYGRSLGTGIAAYLAYVLNKQNINTKGLILISPFASFLKSYVDHSLEGDIFCTDRLAKEITDRTLIIHGNSDWVVLYRNGVRLSSLFPNSVLVTIDGVGHCDIRTEQYYDSIREFVNK